MPAHVAKLVNVAVSEAVGVKSLGVRVSPWAQISRGTGSSLYFYSGSEKFILSEAEGSLPVGT